MTGDMKPIEGFQVAWEVLGGLPGFVGSAIPVPTNAIERNVGSEGVRDDTFDNVCLR